MNLKKAALIVALSIAVSPAITSAASNQRIQTIVPSHHNAFLSFFGHLFRPSHKGYDVR